MRVDTFGVFRINVKGRAFGHKFVVSLEHTPSGRVVWRKKTVHLVHADASRQLLKVVCILLEQRALSVQAAAATNELKAPLAECWREVCGQD